MPGLGINRLGPELHRSGLGQRDRHRLDDLGQVAGTIYSDASAQVFYTGVNASGQVLAAASDMSGDMAFATFVTGPNGQGAFIIEGKGQDMVALSSLAIDFDGYFTEAIAVNNAGQILARDGFRSYLLTPTAIPEAQTSAMLTLGFLGIAGVTGRRAKTAPTAQA